MLVTLKQQKISKIKLHRAYFDDGIVISRLQQVKIIIVINYS
jgi:hypothetical protein